MVLKKIMFAAAFLSAVISVGTVPFPQNAVYAETAAVSSVNTDAPSNFSYDSKATSITLKWSEVKGADAYRVYKYDPKTKKFKKYKNVKNATCKVTGLSKDTKYYFKVAVLKKTDNGYTVGAVSKKFSIKTKLNDLPASPSADYTGLVKYNGNRYYFIDGKLVTGWRLVNNNMYYFDRSTYEATTGWMDQGSQSYYFFSDGKMAINTTITIGENRYTFDKNGILLGERAAFDKLSARGQKLATAIFTYIEQFGSPTSVRIIEAYEYKALVDIDKTRGYYLKISAENKMGGKSVEWYRLYTSIDISPYLSESLGFNEGGPFTIYGKMVATCDADSAFSKSEIKLLNQAISDYLESYGY